MENFLSQNVLSSGLIPEKKTKTISNFIEWAKEIQGKEMKTFQDFLDYVSSPKEITKGIKGIALHRQTMCVMFEIFRKNNSENSRKFWDLIPMRAKARRKREQKLLD